MINAVLVFNNSGQPRLTKFYTQLVLFPNSRASISSGYYYSLQDTSVQQRLISEIFTLVHARPASACNFLPYVRHVAYLKFWSHDCSIASTLTDPQQSSTPSRLHHPRPHPGAASQRYTLPNNIPALRNPLLHPHLHLHRIAPRPPRPRPSLRRSARPTVRERV